MTPIARHHLLAALAGLREPAFTVAGLPLLPSDALGQCLGLWTLCDAVESATPEALARWQRERLDALFTHLRGVSAFWAGRLAGWSGDGTGELVALPPLSRDAVQAQVAAEGGLAVPAGHGAVHAHAASGSTGDALTVHTDAWVGFLNSQLCLRHALGSALPLGATMVIAGSGTDDGCGADWGLPAGALLATGPAVRIRTAGRELGEIVALIARQRGAVLACTPELLVQIEASAAGRVSPLATPATDLRGCVSVVLTQGGPVDAALRETASRVFGARLVDRYSRRDVGPIALDCAEAPGHYHVCTPNAVVEVVDVDGQAVAEGAQGRVLVTALHAAATPFIRYAVGDLARWHSVCPCGHRGPVLSDLARLADGQMPDADLAPQPVASPVISTVPARTSSHSRLLAALSGLRDDAFGAPGLALLPSVDAGQVLGLWTLCDAVEAMASAALARWQQDRLAGLIAHWRAVSPFWAERLAGWQGGPGDLAALAPLSRQQVRAQVAAEGALALPAGHGAAHRNTTSGSTGTALAFHCADWAAFLNGQLYLRHTLQCGIAVEATAILALLKVEDGVDADWGAPAGLLLRTGRQIRWSTLGRDSEGLLRVIAAQRGGLLSTGAESLRLLLAGAADTPGLQGCLSFILTLGAQVDEWMREAALRVFGARVIDRYSCEELGPIALECGYAPGHYHVCTPNVIVELVGLDGQTVAQGEQGRVLATGLQAAATPFVRYELGDLARGHSTCPCGHRGPVLTDILGRAGHIAVFPGGRRRHIHLGVRKLLPIAPVHDYRLLRHEALSLELELTLGEGGLSDAQRDALAALVRAITVDDAVVRVTVREAIDWGPGYKRLTFVDRYARSQAETG